MSERNFDELAEKMYNGSYFTLVGCDLKQDSMKKWVGRMNTLLVEEGLSPVPETVWERFKGSEMNELYHLSGDNRYPDDLTFLAFPIDKFKSDEEIQKLSLIKLILGARWFDDIVVNDLRREEGVIR